MPRLKRILGLALALNCLLVGTARAQDKTDCLDESQTFLKSTLGAQAPLVKFQRTPIDEASVAYAQYSRVTGTQTTPTRDILRTIDGVGGVVIRIATTLSTGGSPAWIGAEFSLPACAEIPLPPGVQSTIVRRPVTSLSFESLTDQKITALQVARQSFWVLAVSPDMPLSFDAIDPVLKLAKEKRARLIIAHANQTTAETPTAIVNKLEALAQGEKATVTVFDSNFLSLAGLINHFPNIAIFKRGQYKGLVSGYKSLGAYREFITHAIKSQQKSSDDLGALRAKLKQISKVRLELGAAETFALGQSYLGSYYRPLKNSNSIAFPISRESLYVYSLTDKRGQVVRMKGSPEIRPYDVIGLPFSPTHALIFSTTSPYRNTILDLAKAVQGQDDYDVIMNEPSGNIYPSAGLIQKTADAWTYQIIRNWGGSSIQTLKLKPVAESFKLITLSEQTAVCSKSYHSQPHIAPQGRYLTATVSGIGKLLHFNNGEVCDVAYDFELPASKIDTNDDASAFAFHASYVHVNGNFFQSTSVGSFYLDRESGRLHKLNTGDQGALLSWYPSFLNNDRIVYYARPAGASEVQAVIVPYQRTKQD